MAERHRLTVVTDDAETDRLVEDGRVLRDVLLEAGFSPYSAVAERLNCGGRGLCATCGVRLLDQVSADHWHDALAERFGYPRLSCQVVVEDDLRVELVADKRLWGRRER